MSVLVPGPEDLRRRLCVGRYGQELETWFAYVEAHAWEWVNARSDRNRPQKIFLVLGQTMTNQYAISHYAEETSTCEVHLRADADFPSIAKLSVLTGYSWGEVSTSAGFQFMKPRDNRLHSVFFNVLESYPTTLFSKPRSQKLLRVFKYPAYFLSLILVSLSP